MKGGKKLIPLNKIDVVLVLVVGLSGKDNEIAEKKRKNRKKFGEIADGDDDDN